MRTVSSTHHLVQTDGSHFYKSADPAVPYAQTALASEAMVLGILGREYDYDGAVLRTPSLGIPMTAPDGGMVARMIETVTTLPDDWHHDLTPVSRMTEHVRTRTTIRVSDPVAVAYCLSLLPSPDREPPVGNQIVHADCHVGNWVVQDGEPVLLDWEAAWRGVAEVSLAALWYGVLVTSGPEAASAVFDVVKDKNAFDWALRHKIAGGMSWLYWKHGPEAVAERAALLRSAGLSWMPVSVPGVPNTRSDLRIVTRVASAELL